MLGWQDSKKIKNDYQIWRWFTPILLHGHLEHIVGNVTFQLYMGSGIEDGIGVIKMVFLYFVSGFGGNLLSSVLNPAAYGVGASTSVFGLVGFYVAYIFSNWSFMGRVKAYQRIFLIIYTSTLVLMNLNIGPHADSKVDNFGHLGGFITGILAGFTITDWFDLEARGKGRTPDRFTDEEYENKSCCCRSWCWSFCGLISLVVWLGGLLIIFYVYVDVDIEQGNIDDP
mmetsp:Transcript_14800/g.25173  ORF Transcript_14800/g.25173 Transcript_14800/m.25173 type:complete len:227 (-) Transcript_14800:75-755(-)